MEHDNNNLCTLQPLTLDAARKLLTDHIDGAAGTPIALTEEKIDKLRRIQNPSLALLSEIWALEDELASEYVDWDTTTNLYHAALDLSGLDAQALLNWLDNRTEGWLQGQELGEVPKVNQAFGELVSDQAQFEATVADGVATVKVGKHYLNVWMPDWWVGMESGVETLIDLHERLTAVV
jgi:hypothetical protein